MISQCFENIWQCYHARLFSFLRSRVAEDVSAEDLLQELFIRVHHNLCCLPPPEKMDGWLYRIARNLVIDHYRSRQMTVPLTSEFPFEHEELDAEPSALLALSLREMVDELPEPYRQALLLTEYQGISQVELAGQLGLSVSAVKSRVQRAREKLRALLLACCHVELDQRGRVIDFYERCCCCNPEP